MIAIDLAHDALIVIDVQPDFMPGGALPVAEGDRIVAPIAQLMTRFRTVVATQDWHPAGHLSFASQHPGKRAYDTTPLHGAEQTLWPDHCLQDSTGAALHAGLPLAAFTLILRKGTRREVDSYSAFRENFGPDLKRAPTGLAALLRERGITRVFLCGLARDFCVRWSAEDAAAAGLTALVVDDLTRSVLPDRAAETTAALERAGVRLTTSKEIQ
jgi:nicotinamidase/pyrazinamidase